MSYQIAHELIFSILLVFCRVGTICMFMPLIGEAGIPQRIRLQFALLLSLIFAFSMPNAIPTKPSYVAEFALLIASEVTIGLTIGIVIKIITTAWHVFGLIFANQSGLSSGMIFDPTQGTQGGIYGNFMSLAFVMIIIVNDIHLQLFQALHKSYIHFPIGSFWQMYDSYVETVMRAAADAFNVGVRLAMPFLIVGLLLNLGAGLISRMIPQMQVFFILLPGQILIHTLVYVIIISSALIWFLDYYQEYLLALLG